MFIRRLCLLVAFGGTFAIAIGGPDESLGATVVAQTGFNNSRGIEPSSLYTNESTIIGVDDGVSGWDGAWQMVQSTTAPEEFYFATNTGESEGDLALQIANSDSSVASTIQAYREYTDQTGSFYVDTMVKASGTLVGEGFIMYTGPNSPTFGSGTASMVSLRPGTDRSIGVSMGNGAGGYSWVDTGRDWTPNRWVRFTQEIDVPNNTYRVWINGQEHVHSTPLGFRTGSVTSVDDVTLYFARHAGGQTATVDEIRILDYNPLEAFASTGFDSSAGYVDGETIVGKADGENYWTSTWGMTRAGGTPIAQSATVKNGDLALKLGGNSSDLMIHREYEDQNTMFYVDFDVLLEDELTNSLYVYLGADSPDFVGTGPDTGAGPMLRFHSNGNLMLGDGQLNGTRIDEDSGLDWTPGQWHHVQVLVNVPSETFEVVFDGTRIDTPDPLGFRRSSMFVDDIQFLLQAQTDGASVYVDNLRISVPEPASILLLLLGGFGAIFGRRRRR